MTNQNATTETVDALDTKSDGVFVKELALWEWGVSARILTHDPERANAVTGQFDLPLGQGRAEATLRDAGCEAVLEASPVPGRTCAWDLKLTFRCVSGRLENASVSLLFGFGDWSPDHYVLLPSSAYQGNRFVSRKIPYSPKASFPEDLGPDVPMVISDVPRLELGAGRSRLHDRSGSMSVPSVGFHDPAKGVGFLLLSPQANDCGDFGYVVEESTDRKRGWISLQSPLVRENSSYRICNLGGPVCDMPMSLDAGGRIVITARIFRFVCHNIQGLFDELAVRRKDVARSGAAPAVFPFSACFELQEEKFNRDNFVPEHGYFAVGPRQNFLQDWQIGWTGGMISTYPLLLAGKEATRGNVIRNFDWLFPDGISPSGLFWDSGRNGTEWIGGDIRKPHTHHWHLVRKSGDAVFYIIRQFRVMEKLGIPVKASWRDGTRKVCDALTRLWDQHGQFGQFVHAVTGAICVGGSSSGAIIPAALVLAADYYQNREYLEIAAAAADRYYREFTVKGMSCGGPGDALQNPDSESWYSLIESYVALYEATGGEQWLARAAETSRQFASWVVGYDFKFPSQSTFAKAGIRTTGSVYANTQNKHSAPGLCTFSGLGLLKLFRATGDRFHLDLLRDIAFGLPQYLPHPLKPFGDAKPGWMCERVNMTDWEGPERIGETLGMTTWAETSLMLTVAEIPGLYIRSDLGLVCCFDHIEASIIHDTPDSVVVRMVNPTIFEAKVTIVIEDRAGAAAPWPEGALLDARCETLAPGGSREICFSK